jgi:hypothetical protein
MTILFSSKGKWVDQVLLVRMMAGFIFFKPCLEVFGKWSLDNLFFDRKPKIKA